MACFHPMPAWYSTGVNPTGKRSLTFKEANAYKGDDPKYRERLEIPCGQCIGCRLERSRVWAMRCLHESSLYEDNCFLTLTYNNESLPENLSLDKTHLQKFWKRLRKKFPEAQIRYFACGEYGDQYKRPHYHACVFNFDFEDKELWKIRDNVRLYTSETLNQIWGLGYCVIGDVTFESAAYVARYVMKKQTGEKAKLHYNFVDDSTGEIHKVIPEFNVMSRRPGIGKEWYNTFSSDCYPKDYITVNGVKMKPPKYYDLMLEEENPELFELIKERRKEEAKSYEANNTGERLLTREKLQTLKCEKLVRTEQ